MTSFANQLSPQQATLLTHPPQFTIPYKQSTFIHGDTGIGKSIVAVQNMYHWLNTYLQIENAPYRELDQLTWHPDWRIDSDFQSNWFRFISFAQIIRYLRALKFTTAENRNEREYIEQTATVGFVILDDFGRGKLDDSDQELLRVWLEDRINHPKTYTLVTSNYTLENLQEMLGSPITSRLQQMCPAQLTWSGKDLRTIKSQQLQLS